jgi:hypothetical protein
VKPLSRLLALGGAGSLAGAFLVGGPIGIVGGLLLGGFADEVYSRASVKKIGVRSPPPGFGAGPTATGLRAGERLARGQQIASPSGAFFLTLDQEGELAVLTSGYQPVWAAGIAGQGGVVATMQRDGALVVLGPDRAVVWSSGTTGPGNRLTVHDDGNLVVYSSMGIPAWQSNTAQA